MTSKKISELAALSSADSNDIIPIVDINATETKKITKTNLMASPGEIGGTTPAAGNFTTLSAEDSLRQVNLLTNSGFGVWSNSTLENVGTQITLTDVTNGICLTADTQDLVIGKLFRFDSGDFSGNVYEVTAVTEDVSFTVHDTSITDTGSPGTGYEVTPGIVAAGGEAMDTWTKSGTLDLFRIQNDTVHCKGFYGTKFIKGVDTSEYLIWQGNIDSKLEHYFKFLGRSVSFGCWVYSVTAADNVKVQISDSGGIDTSPSVGADSLTWVEIARSIGGTITSFRPRFLFGGDTGDIAYISQPMLIFGSSIGEGNYVAPQGEVVFMEDSVTLTDYDGDDTVSADVDINLEAQSNGKIPKGVKGVYARLIGECATPEKYLQLDDGANAIGPTVYSQVANILNADIGWVPCDSDGDIDITRDDTFANVKIDITGVRL